VIAQELVGVRIRAGCFTKSAHGPNCWRFPQLFDPVCAAALLVLILLLEVISLHISWVETVQEQVQTSKTPKCTFFGVVPIDSKRFTDSGIAVMECPDCSRTRSLSPVKGVLRFLSHTRRKIQTPVTGRRWAAKGKTHWDVVDGQ